MRRVILSWSSGKDSAWALHLLRRMPDVEVVALVTTFNHLADRVAMHAVRRTLVHAQAERTGLPLWPMELPWPCANDQYEFLMGELCQRAVREDITHVAFGDLFLEDIPTYREKQLRDMGLQPLFPVWHLPTRNLAEEMIRSGVRARITCIDPTKLDDSFIGREFGRDVLAALSPSADPCGENGEFHTFFYDSPVFSHPIAIEMGEVVERDGFVFADVLPAAN